VKNASTVNPFRDQNTPKLGFTGAKPLTDPFDPLGAFLSRGVEQTPAPPTATAADSARMKQSVQTFEGNNTPVTSPYSLGDRPAPRSMAGMSNPYGPGLDLASMLRNLFGGGTAEAATPPSVSSPAPAPVAYEPRPVTDVAAIDPGLAIKPPTFDYTPPAPIASESNQASGAAVNPWRWELPKMDTPASGDGGVRAF